MLTSKQNVVKIEGILSEIDLEYGSFKKNGETRNSIGGTIKVRVTQNIAGKDTELEIPVHMFASELTNKGTANPAYESIERVKTEYVSIAAGGIDAADRIRITNGQISMNEYYGQNGNLISFPRITASFITKIKKEDCSPKATFEAIFAIGNMGYETDAEGVETDKYIIKGILPQWGGKVDVVDFIAAAPSVVDVISNSWQQGDTVRATGRLNFSSRTEKVVTEVDFGEPIEDTRTISVSELLITGGSSTPMDGDFAFDTDEIAEGLKERQNRLAELKEKAQNKGKKSTTSASTNNKFKDLGF